MSAPSILEHPSPHRRRIRLAPLLSALAAGPAAWIVQLVAGYGFASYACAPSGVPRGAAPPGWALERAGLFGVNIACLAIVLAAGGVAWRAWRLTRAENVGEGRTRFLAACGTMTCGAFALAVLFNTVGLVMIPACGATNP